MEKEYFCIKTEKGYFGGWKRASYIDPSGKKRFSGREPQFVERILFAFDNSVTIGDTAESVKRNLCTRGYQAEIIPVFWANGRWQKKQPAPAVPTGSRAMTPKRIQRKRTRGWRAPANTLNITRPGKHGNPYPVIDGDVVTSLRKFESYLEMMIATEPKQYAALVYEVRRADFIMCFCPVDAPCHGDVWIEHAKE